MGGVQAGEALHLVPKAAVLVARLQELPPHRVEPLVVVLQQPAVPVPHLQAHAPGYVSVTVVLQRKVLRGNGGGTPPGILLAAYPIHDQGAF